MSSMGVHEKLMEVNMALLNMNIKKSGFNKHKGFPYYELMDMIPTVTKLCYGQRLGIEFPYADDVAILRIVNLDNKDDYVVFRLTFPELIAEEKNPNNKLIQAYGADITYLQRYLLKLAFPSLSDKDVIDSDEPTDDASSAKQEPSAPSKKEVAEVNVPELIVAAEAVLKKKGVPEADITSKALKQTVLKLEKWSVPERRAILNYFKEKEASK